MQKPSEVVNVWAEHLASRLGRSAVEIRNRGLSVYDFSAENNVKLNFGDGSVAEFKHAFACINKEGSMVAIFTEHCGYLEFGLVPEMEVIEVRETYFRHE